MLVKALLMDPIWKRVSGVTGFPARGLPVHMNRYTEYARDW